MIVSSRTRCGASGSRRAAKVSGNHLVTRNVRVVSHPVNARRRAPHSRDADGFALDRLACRGACDAAARRGHSGASAGARCRAQARCAPPARAHPLLSRCRRRRARGRRPHHAIRDPRCRALSAGAGARDADGAPNGAEDAAGDDRGPRRAHRAGGARGADRARPRLPRRPALARRHEGRERGRADRACARRSRARSRWSASICSPPSAASCCRSRSGAASRRSRTWSRSRSRRSTATARSTWCAAWSRPAPQDRITLYTGNDDHIVLDLVTPFAVTVDGQAARPCASRAGCSATGACG